MSIRLFYDLQPEDLIGGCRRSPIVQARREFSQRARREEYTYMQIGEAINRDHSTIMHYEG